jgi:hypothetical protein
MPTITRKAKAAVAALGLGGIIAASALAPVDAASHREAPLIAQDPAADNTDVYAYVSGANNENVTLIANYIPLQDPFGGPNYFFFGEDVLYSIHVDNDGDAIPNITYEFRFTTENAVPGVPVYTTQQIDSLDDPWNLKQTYTLSVVEDGQRTVLGEGLPVPPVNIGPRTTPNYSTLALSAVRDVAGGTQVFAGQRDEAFSADLGSIFDLGGLRPLNPAHTIPLPVEDGVKAFRAKNVHSLALEVPTSELVDGDPVIGVWATASRQKVRVFNQNSGAAPVNRGRFVQVSRLGNPLVNELVFPISLKDVFNSLEPRLDAEVLSGLEVEPFATEGPIPLVTDPILADLIEVLYPGVETPPDGQRTDLVKIFLTGIDEEFASQTGLPVTNQQNGVPADMLRLNTSIPDSAFPNGRKLTDDVVDIALQAVAGEFFVGEGGDRPFNRAPNNELTDGVSGNDMPFLDVFPFIAHPHSGYDTEPLGDITTNSVENDNL